MAGVQLLPMGPSHGKSKISLMKRYLPWLHTAQQHVVHDVQPATPHILPLDAAAGTDVALHTATLLPCQARGVLERVPCANLLCCCPPTTTWPHGWGGLRLLRPPTAAGNAGTRDTPAARSTQVACKTPPSHPPDKAFGPEDLRWRLPHLLVCNHMTSIVRK